MSAHNFAHWVAMFALFLFGYALGRYWR